MKIHEYQAKNLFRDSGIAVPHGYVASNINEALEVYKKIKTDHVIVKAQIHAGGRGKGGGVKSAYNEKEVIKLAKNMLGMHLITHQTGPKGQKVQCILIEEASEIDCEMYAGIVLDRSCGQYVFMVSTEGGVEIEKIAIEKPKKIVKEWINPNKDLISEQAINLATALNLSENQIKQAKEIFLNLWNLFKQYDCSIMEINPLVTTKSNKVIALDAKINFDENALFRHENILKLRDLTEEEPLEVKANSYNLNYIKLDGNVGCMVNGAGLAMGTMDIIKLHGGEPANFLDVGGIANAETVTHGFNIILSDINVKSILINIFGGIVRCDRVAKGVIEALNQINVKIPIIIRLEGTNAQAASKLLLESEHNFIVANSLENAAKLAVENSKLES